MKFIALLLCLFSLVNAADKRYVIATASAGGVYYPVGVGFATLSTAVMKDKGIMFSAVSSNGSGENIDMLDKGEANFAFLHGTYDYMSWEGKLLYENNKKPKLRTVARLWYNVEHFVVLSEYAKTGNIMDLTDLYGKSFNIGQKSGGAKYSGELILSALNIDYNQMNLQYVGFNSGADGMQDGRIKGVNSPAGLPVPSITNLYATLGKDKMTVLSFSDEDLKKVRKSFPIWEKYVIKANTYPGQSEDIVTIAQPNMFVTTEDTPEEVVYLMTKAIFENMKFLNTVHKATLEINLESASKTLSIPLHPGAKRYYKEMGIKFAE